MKLISKDGAIAVISVLGDEVVPLNNYHLPTLFSLIAETYAFATVPSVAAQGATNAKFEHGRLVTADGRVINISEFSMYSDGLRVVTTDTADSDVVIDDAYECLRQRAGFRAPITTPIRRYQSDLVVDLDNDASKAFRFFDVLAEMLKGEVKGTGAPHRSIEVRGFGFGSDPSLGNAVEFGIERRVGAPWDANRYFSKAYLPTPAHLRLLEALDQLLGSS